MGRGHKKKRAARGPFGGARSQRRSILTGTVQLTDGRGFVRTAEGDFKLSGHGSRWIMDGDTIAISFKRGARGDKRAVPESVIKRATTHVVGTYAQAGPLGAIRPLDARMRADFFVLPEDASAERLHVAEGDVVSARILTYPTRMESGVVTIERRIGAVDAPDVGVQCVMARYGLEAKYPSRALAEAGSLWLDIDSALADPLRRDIRDRFVITIDPVDARDFDDAISIERTADGGFDLGVHIADVSHYVGWGSHIDMEARHRTTSVYLADRVLPMLPERLSNDLCSLRPDEDRLAFTVDMHLDTRGRVRGYTAYPSIIRSHVRMDYAGADTVLARVGAVELTGGSDDATQTRAVTCEAAAKAYGVDLGAFLTAAYELSQLRRALRHARGSIDFNTVEIHALLDDSGAPTDLIARHRTPATGLIEEAMLLANECVAEILADDDIATAYRVHDAPSPDALHGVAVTLAELGVVSSEEASGIALGDQDVMQHVVNASANGPFEPLVNTLMLRSMQRALYKPHNEGHYALGARAYCHFTSPIRRYPDLMVHRALKMKLARERLGAQAAKERASHLVGTGRECQERIAVQLCRACSERERTADMAAKATQKIKIAQFYEKRIGERYRGAVSWVSNMGVFVRMDDTQVEGLVPIKSLGDEWFDYDEDTLTLTGSDTGTRYELGMPAVVEVESVNTVRGHLDLRLVHVSR